MRRTNLDVDEVLADFVSPAVALISAVLGRPWILDEEASRTQWDIFAEMDPEVRAAVFAEIGRPGFANNLQPIPGSQDFVRELRKHREVLIVTAPFPSPSWEADRNAWLGDHFGIPESAIRHARKKDEFAADEYLDDHPIHVIDWRAAHPKGHGMLWSTAHNKRLSGYDHLRVHSWDEVLRHVIEGATP